MSEIRAALVVIILGANAFIAGVVVGHLGLLAP